MQIQQNIVIMNTKELMQQISTQKVTILFAFKNASA